MGIFCLSGDSGQRKANVSFTENLTTDSIALVFLLGQLVEWRSKKSKIGAIMECFLSDIQYNDRLMKSSLSA